MVVLPTEKRIDWTRPPIAVFALILINVLVFLIYQSGDDKKFENAVREYQSRGLNELELAPYENFWEKTYGEKSGLTFAEYKRENPNDLLGDMVFNDKFAAFVAETDSFYKSDPDLLNRWRSDREKVQAIVNTVSYRAYGLSPKEFSIVTLITHQFLHGDTWHLLGNMVFLLICGFAVEAALGLSRFVVYYLIGGVGGGLMYCIFPSSFDGSTHLVGASGAISAVMAMYVTLFQLKKIEFFYWAFVFVGYFRAPALWLLPFYIVSELMRLIFDDNSPVAYSAHVGGFLAGGSLIFYTLYTNSRAIDQDYLEQNQQVDTFLQDQDKVYRAIASYDFSRALKLVNEMIATHGEQTPLLQIKLNLFKAVGGDNQKDFLIECLNQHNKLEGLATAWSNYWRSLEETEQFGFENETQAKIALKLLDNKEGLASEKILKNLLEKNFVGAACAKLARRLSHFYEREGYIDKKLHYDQLADELTAKL